jgi:hypothetical protein
VRKHIQTFIPRETTPEATAETSRKVLHILCDILASQRFVNDGLIVVPREKIIERALPAADATVRQLGGAP